MIDKEFEKLLQQMAQNHTPENDMTKPKNKYHTLGMCIFLAM